MNEPFGTRPTTTDLTARADIASLDARLRVLTRFVASQHPEEWDGTPPVTTHVWCESDGNDGVVPATHRVYEGGYRGHPDNPICDGSRATHYPLHRGTPHGNH